jgi:hypothetical protein
MKHVRGVILGIAMLGLISCGKPDEAPEAAAPPSLTAWSDLSADNIFVPEGVFYTVSTVGEQAAAEIAAVPEDATSTWRTGGVGVRLSDAFESEASGKRIRVTVRAAAPDANAQLGVAYSTAEAGNSGWQQFTLTPTPSDYAFEYDVPALIEGKGDFLGFRSYGDSRVQVLGFRTEVIGPSTAAAPAPAATP